jgi:hypothetical protein
LEDNRCSQSPLLVNASRRRWLIYTDRESKLVRTMIATAMP